MRSWLSFEPNVGWYRDIIAPIDMIMSIGAFLFAILWLIPPRNVSSFFQEP